MAEPYDFRAYFRRLGWGVLVGLLSGIGAFIFVGLMNTGLDHIWPDPPSWQPFSGSWTIVIIMTLAGLLVGPIHQFTATEQMLVSLVSLIGGFSLGPEVPTGMWAEHSCSRARLRPGYTAAWSKRGCHRCFCRRGAVGDAL